MEKQKCLVIDIETAPILAYVWDTRDQNIAVNQIVKDWHIIAYSAKWLGGNQQVYADKRHSWSNGNDESLVTALWKLLDTADIVIGQNSKAFDAKKIVARMQYYGMKPPSPYKHLDTYLIAKNSGAFTKNSLEYLTKYLGCKHHKSPHNKFPGMTLWNECLVGNQVAWAEMEKYNRNDVIVTEELYDKLSPWIPKTAPSVYIGECCRSCGGNIEHRGFSVTRVGTYPRLHCLKCGLWDQGRKCA